jgi:uncharacterized protein YjbI with pentapeptide repeats
MEFGVHVEILARGPSHWNEWRLAHPESPDLFEANLPGANLRGCDLSGADLRGANFSGADLCAANLSGAQLDEANFVRAELVGAHLLHASLERTNFGRADLEHANLTYARMGAAHCVGTHLPFANLYAARLKGVNFGGAELGGANFSHAILDGAELCGANLAHTSFAFASLIGADLRDARVMQTVFASANLTDAHLDACVHETASALDVAALANSGMLPLPFLRGCGLPDSLIDYLPSLLARGIEFYSCFISYSSKDEEFAVRLHADLQNRGVRCWFAPHDLKIGAKTWDTIDEAIRLRDKVLLLLSDNSIRSDWVEDEVSKGYAEERQRGTTVLFPVRIDDAVMTTTEPWAVKLRDQRNIGDFRRWKDHDAYGKSFERLLRDLKVTAAPA